MIKPFTTTCFALAALTLMPVPGQAQPPAPPEGLLALTNAIPTLATNPVGGRIKFATNEYDFGRIQSGAVVKFAYVFTNVGDQTLEVTGVQPQCGCTTAGDWSRKVEPGQTGTIPIQYNSGHSMPMPVVKTVTITSSDHTQSPLVLRLKGTIWNPIEVQPGIAALNISPDSDSGSTTMRVINNMETPVNVFDPESSTSMLTLKLETNTPGKEYTLTASVAPPLSPTSAPAQITLKTSSTNMPTVTAMVYLNVLPAVIVSPPEIRLSQAPLGKALTASVAIQNNGTNQLILTEPTVNAEKVDVQIKEMQPGKLFTVLVAFPEGFQAAAGQQTVVTFKSNSPKAPVIRIPVSQIPPPPVLRADRVASPALPKPPMPPPPPR